MTAEQAYIGIIVNGITIIPAFLIMFMFKKAKPMRLRENRVDRAFGIKKEKSEKSVTATVSAAGEDSGLGRSFSTINT
jgi:hypothetical protein